MSQPLVRHSSCAASSTILKSRQLKFPYITTILDRDSSSYIYLNICSLTRVRARRRLTIMMTQIGYVLCFACVFLFLGSCCVPSSPPSVGLFSFSCSLLLWLLLPTYRQTAGTTCGKSGLSLSFLLGSSCYFICLASNILCSPANVCVCMCVRVFAFDNANKNGNK